MRDYQIKIEPFEFIALQELQIKQKINDHATAEVTMRIRDDWKEKYIGTLAGETWVKIIGVDKQEESAVYTVLFYGLVTDFSFIQDGYETLFKLEITSGTILMDLKPHFRVFQNEKTACAQIHQRITGAYPEGQASCVESSQDRTEGVLIQFKETDWEFLKRLAGRNGWFLTPDALNKGVRYVVGLPSGRNREINTERIRIRLDTREYMEKSCNGMTDLQPADLVEITFTDREIYSMGDTVMYQGKKYYIYQIFTCYEEAECSHEYFLRVKEALKVMSEANRSLSGCSFNAVISNVQKDKVQVEIVQDEWKAVDGKKWFLYSTVYSSPDGTGWYCMPEVGDSVRLYVPEKDEDSFIISSVHRETDSARQNPDHKSLKTKYGKEILFTPNAILMTNNQGMMVEMDDSEGITITSDKDILIQAQENLTVASGSASLLIAADDKVQVKQGGTTMTLRGDISFTGGEFRIQ